MKIEGEVLAVETTGECYRVRCQGTSPGNADWRPWQSFSFEVPATTRNGQTFYIGRKVQIIVKAKT